MRNKYPGVCYYCGTMVEKGDGHFERHKGRWYTIHATCVFKQRKEKEEKLNARLLGLGNPEKPSGTSHQ